MSSYSGSSTSGFSWTGVAGLFLLDGFFLPPVFVSPVSDLCDEVVGSLSEDCLVDGKATFCVSVATGSAVMTAGLLHFQTAMLHLVQLAETLELVLDHVEILL